MDTTGWTATEFGERHFGTAEFGDARLTRRLVQTGNRMAEHPGGTRPQKLACPADLKGLYRLLGHDKVTYAGVLGPHWERTRDRMRAASGPVLLLQDDTELDYTGNTSIAELGSIGTGKRHRGYVCHNTLAVAAGTREVLGLAHQHLHRRADPPPGETRRQRQRRADRESRLWTQASRAVGPPPEGRRWVDVCDRGADLFESVDAKDQQRGHSVVRSRHNRQITRMCGGEAEQTRLHDLARRLPSQGGRTLDVPARPGQPARTARLLVAWEAVTLQPPKNPRGQHRDGPLAAWVVRTWEVDPPEGAKPLEWILLTNVPVQTLEDAGTRLAWSAQRWMVEEYHKALKTGVRIESLQFTSEDALRPAIALLSVVGLLLLELRDQSRRPEAQARPAGDLFPVELVRVLAGWRFGRPERDLTVHEFFLALARLGGHQNRKHDAPPAGSCCGAAGPNCNSCFKVRSPSDRNRCG